MAETGPSFVLTLLVCLLQAKMRTSSPLADRHLLQKTWQPSLEVASMHSRILVSKAADIADSLLTWPSCSAVADNLDSAPAEASKPSEPKGIDAFPDLMDGQATGYDVRVTGVAGTGEDPEREKFESAFPDIQPGPQEPHVSGPGEDTLRAANSLSIRFPGRPFRTAKPLTRPSPTTPLLPLSSRSRPIPRSFLRQHSQLLKCSRRRRAKRFASGVPSRPRRLSSGMSVQSKSARRRSSRRKRQLTRFTKSTMRRRRRRFGKTSEEAA